MVINNSMGSIKDSVKLPQMSQEIKPLKINHKESHIGNLFELLGLQSFDGKFLPNESFYEFFDKNDFMNLKQEIEKEIGKDEKIEEILSTCISMSYLEII